MRQHALQDPLRLTNSDRSIPHDMVTSSNKWTGVYHGLSNFQPASAKRGNLSGFLSVQTSAGGKNGACSNSSLLKSCQSPRLAILDKQLSTQFGTAGTMFICDEPSLPESKSAKKSKLTWQQIQNCSQKKQAEPCTGSRTERFLICCLSCKA